MGRFIRYVLVRFAEYSTAQEQLRAENEELKWRRKKEEDWQKANDQRVCLHLLSGAF